ncbi:uncharacterized protein LOC129978635 [Argiope bruennichi]|uniref:uncharacterized protein LOC129978635 n=1 Tax=Argiope bruennichi TaxID=94029 RepID=UPI0024955166|nr:uncharacterized protein LOC129978635 [Argiope bruennichi]
MLAQEMTSPLLLLFTLSPLLCQTGVLAQEEECDDAAMRRCRREGLEAIDGRKDNDPCKTIRKNFDCLLWQTSMCLDKDEQDENRESIMKMWRYLQSFCESEGNWYTKSCFQREDVKRCEGLLPARGYSIDTTSCRAFSSFRDCVSTVVLVDCSASDRRLFGTYLMEKGQQRAWNCPRSTRSPNSAPLAAQDVTDIGSYGSCSLDSRTDLEECRTTFYSAQREARNRNDSDMRHHGTCCALVHYEECVKKTLRSWCGDTSRAKTEARNIIADMKERFPNHSCEDHTETECSSAPVMLVVAGLPLITMLILLYVQRSVL